MPCHPLEPYEHPKDRVRCPSCGVHEGELHRDVCPIYAFAGAKRQIYFKPSPEVKAAMPYVPGERQAKAIIPQYEPRRINLDQKETPRDILAEVLDYLAQEFIKERANVNTVARHDAILKAIDAIQALRFLENK